MESTMEHREDAASEVLDPSVMQYINTLIGMPYKNVQSLATQRSLPANLKKLEMATLIALHRSGKSNELERALHDVRESRQVKRQVKDAHSSTTTAEADSASAGVSEDEEDDAYVPYAKDDDDEDYEPCKSKKVKLDRRPKSEAMDVDNVEVVHTAEGEVLDKKPRKKTLAARSKTSRISKNGRVIKQRRDYCYIYPQIAPSPTTTPVSNAPPAYTSIPVLHPQAQGVQMKPAPLPSAVFPDKNNNSLLRTAQYAPIASNTVSSSQAMSTVVVGVKSRPPVSTLAHMKHKSWSQDVNSNNWKDQGQMTSQPYTTMLHQKHPSVKSSNPSIGAQHQPLTHYANQPSLGSRQNPLQGTLYLQHNEAGISSKSQEPGNLTRSGFGQNLMPAGLHSNRVSHNVNTHVLPQSLGLHHMVNPNGIQQAFPQPTINMSTMGAPGSYQQAYPLSSHNMQHGGKLPVPPFQSVQKRPNLTHQQYPMPSAQVPVIQPLSHQEMMQSSQSHSFQASSLVSGQFQMMHQQQTFSGPLYPLQHHPQQNPRMYSPYSQLAPYQVNTKFPHTSIKPVLQPNSNISSNLEKIFNIRGDKLSLPSSLWPYWKPAVTQSVNSYPAPICVPSNAPGLDQTQLWDGYGGAGKAHHTVNKNFPQSHGSIRQETFFEHQQKMLQEAERLRHIKLREMWEETKREELIRQQQRQLMQQQSQHDLQLRHQSQLRSHNSQHEVPYPGFRGQNNQLSYPLIYNYITAAEEQLQQMDLKQQQQLLQELQQHLQQPATAANPSQSDVSMQSSPELNVDVCDLPPILNQVDMAISQSFNKEELMSVQSIPLEEGEPMSFGIDSAVSMIVDSPDVLLTRPVSFDQHAEITKPNLVEFTQSEPVQAESSCLMSTSITPASSFTAPVPPTPTGPAMIESPKLPRPAAPPSVDLSFSTIVPTSTLPNIHELVPTIFKSLDMFPNASNFSSQPSAFPNNFEHVSKDNPDPLKVSLTVPPTESAIAPAYQSVCTNPVTLDSTSSAVSVCGASPTTFSQEMSVPEQEPNQSRSSPQDCLLGNYHVDKNGCLHPVQATESEYIQDDSPPVKKVKFNERHIEIQDKTLDSVLEVTQHDGNLCSQAEAVCVPKPSRNEICSPKSPRSQLELALSKEIGITPTQVKPGTEEKLCQESIPSPASATAETKTALSPIPKVDSGKFSEEITSVKSPVLGGSRTENIIEDDIPDLMEEVTVTVQDQIERTIETYVRVDNETNQVIAVFSNECGEMMTLSVSRDVPDCPDPLCDTPEEISLSRASTVIVSQSPEYKMSSCDVNRNVIDLSVVTTEDETRISECHKGSQDVIHQKKTPSEATTVSVSHSSLEKRNSDEISPSQATTVSVTHSSLEERISDEMLREVHPSLLTTVCVSDVLNGKSSTEDSTSGNNFTKSSNSDLNEASPIVCDPDVMPCSAPERQQSPAILLCSGCGSISFDKSCTVCKKGTDAVVGKNSSQDSNPSQDSSSRSINTSVSTLTASSISDYLSQRSSQESTMPKSTSSTEGMCSSTQISSCNDEDSRTAKADDDPLKIKEESNKDKSEGESSSIPLDTQNAPQNLSLPVPWPHDAKEQGEQRVAITLPRRSAGKVPPGKQPRAPVRCSPRTTTRRQGQGQGQSPTQGQGQDSAGTSQVGMSAMQQLAKQGRKPCSNSERGCLLILAPAQLSSHELVCDFTLVECPVHGCTWHGMARRMCSHARETHRSLIMAGAESSHTVSLQQVRAQRHVTFLREVSRKLFVIGVHALGHAVFATIQSVTSGRAERPVAASGTLELVGQDGRVHCWRGSVCAIQQNIQLLRAWGNCLEVQPEVVAAFGSSLITVHANIRVLQGPTSLLESGPASV